MKNFLKKIFVLGAILLSILSVNFMASQTTVSAASDNELGSCRTFLGLKSWDCNIPKTVDDTDDLSSTVWIIAANVLNDILVIAAYLVIGYVIYGGYQYIFASGDSGKAANGKKTLAHAFIGLALILLSNIIITSISFALLKNNEGFARNCIESETACIDNPDNMIKNAIQWVIGISGLVAAIFIVVGGVGYVTSAGDSSKLQKAKTTILYALIGLLIVGLSELIVIFVSNLILNNSAN